MPIQRPADGSRTPPKVIVTAPVIPPRAPLRITVDGAIIEEALDSDAGNVLTLDRKDVAKRYICRLPDIQDKPGRFLQTAFPLGSYYPGNDPNYVGLIVFGYDEGDRINESDTAWHSTVIYSTLDQLAVLDWVTEGEFSEEQEHIERDLSAVYGSAGSVEGGSGDPNDPTYTQVGSTIRVGRFIGSAVYEPIAADDSATYSAESAIGGRIALAKTGAFKVTGLDRYRGLSRFTMTRTLFSLTWRQIHSVGGRVCTVNSERFLFYEPGELLLLNFAWRETFGLFPSTQATSNKNYEVRLQFAHNPLIWSPVIQYDKYEDDHDFKANVVLASDSSYVVREFHSYQYSAFIGIFNILNTTAPVPT